MSETTTNSRPSGNVNATHVPPTPLPQCQMSDADWLRALQHPDPLMKKLEQTAIPLRAIHDQMAQILQSHLQKHPHIGELQDIYRQIDQLLQYSRQLGRLMKLELEVRVPAGKFDPMQHFEPLQLSEKPAS